MTKKEKHNPGTFVTVKTCKIKHSKLVNEIQTVKTQVSEIKRALIGDPLNANAEPGLVQRVKDIQKNSKSKLTGRDKAFIIGSFLTAASVSIAAFIKVLLA